MLILAILLAASPAQNARSPLEGLVGHCWSARLGADTIDRHCFRRIHGGAHIKDEHIVSVKGRPVYSGETIYSVENDALTFTYFSSLGGVGRGSVTRTGKSLQFNMAMRASPAAELKNIAVTWRFGADGYDVIDAEGERRFRRDSR